MNFLFMLISLAAGGGVIMMSGKPLLFLDAPSLAIVVGISVLLTLSQHPFKSILAALRAVFMSGVDHEQIREHQAVLRTLRVTALGSGVVGTLIGLVNMLANMSDPSALGPAISVACLTMLYGVVIAEVLIGPTIGGMSSVLPIPDAQQDGETATGDSTASTERPLLWPVLGLLGMLTFVLMGILFGGHLGIFIDLTSILLVLGVGISLILSRFSPSALCSTIIATLRRRPLPSAVAVNHRQVFVTIRSLFHGLAAVGVLVGLVQLFAHLDDPRAIGPAMAVALLSALYGLICAELFVAPMANGISARVTDPESLELEAPRGGLLPTSFFFISSLAVFFILIAVMK